MVPATKQPLVFWQVSRSKELDVTHSLTLTFSHSLSHSLTHSQVSRSKELDVTPVHFWLRADAEACELEAGLTS